MSQASSNIFSALRSGGHRTEAEAAEVAPTASSAPSELIPKFDANMNWGDEVEENSNEVDEFYSGAPHTINSLDNMPLPQQHGRVGSDEEAADGEDVESDEEEEEEDEQIDIAALGVDLNSVRKSNNATVSKPKKQFATAEQNEVHPSGAAPGSQALSRKERQARELEELDAMLSEFGVGAIPHVAAAPTGADEPRGTPAAATEPSSTSSKKKRSRRKKQKGGANANATEEVNEQDVQAAQVADVRGVIRSKMKAGSGGSSKKGSSRGNNTRAKAIAVAAAEAKKKKAKAGKAKDKRKFNEMPTY